MLEEIRDGRTDKVFDYLSDGNTAQTRDENGVSLASWCAYHGDVSALRLLLQEGESLQSLGENLGLHAAAFHGHWQLCQFLVENGADANHQLKDTGESPLHAAVCKANRPIYDHVLEILLAAGADPNMTTKVNVETGSFMRDCRTRAETPLHRAAAFGTGRCIEMLLAAGADPEAKDLHGDSPLSWASWHLRPPAILRLLCYGDYTVHAGNDSSYDHGAGWGQLDASMMTRPHAR